MSSHERTGWRDEKVSRRHREYGVNVPAVDVDFLLIEYDKGEPAALADLKHHAAAPVDRNSPSMRALSMLGTDWKRPLPVLVVRYWPETWAYRVNPLNDAGRDLFSTAWACNADGSVDMCEFDYVRLLYHIRGREMPSSLTVELHQQMPPATAASLLR